MSLFERNTVEFNFDIFRVLSGDVYNISPLLCHGCPDVFIHEATFIQAFLCFFHPPSSVSPSPFIRAPSTLDSPIILHFLDSSAKP